MIKINVERQQHATPKILGWDLSRTIASCRRLWPVAVSRRQLSIIVVGRRQFCSVVVENYQVVPNEIGSVRVFIDMNSSSSISLSQLQPVLERALRDYQPLTSQAAVLESFKPIILGLRAKRATYQTIRELLAEHGILVSDQAVTRFCRKYSTEIKRLSQGLQEHKALEVTPATPSILPASTEAGLTTTLNPASQPQKKMRSLRGPV